MNSLKCFRPYRIQVNATPCLTALLCLGGSYSDYLLNIPINCCPFPVLGHHHPLPSVELIQVYYLGIEKNRREAKEHFLSRMRIFKKTGGYSTNSDRHGN